MAGQGPRTASGRSIELTGVLYGDKAFEALSAELYAQANAIIEASLPLVPVDTGSLRASSYVTEPERNGDHVTVEFGYGGVATKINPKTGEPTGAYAVYVHENLEAHHKVGQAKYLQTPAEEAFRDMPEKIAAGMNQRMRGGGEGTEDQSGGGGAPE